MRRRALALGQAARGAARRFTCAGRHWLTMNKPPPCRGLGLRRLPLALSQAAVPPPSFAAKGLLPGARNAVQC
jgi:hypothetical protein